MVHNYQQLETELNALKSELGLVGGRLALTPVKDVQSVEACIDLSDDHIEMKFSPDWNPARIRRIAAFCKKKAIDNPAKKVLEDILHHETGHWELKYGTGNGCPYDLAHKDILLDTVIGVLKTDNKTQAMYLENAIEDIVDNPNCANYTSHDGMAIFFAEQGSLAGGKFTPVYDAFVRLNMYLWGDKHQKSLLKKCFGKDPRVKKAVQETIQELRLTEDRENNMQILFNKEDWPHIVKVIAEKLAPLMDVPPKENLPGTGMKGYGNSDGQEKGEAQQGEDKDDFMENARSWFDQKLNDSQELKKIVLARYEKGITPPRYLEKFHSLDLLYQGLAGIIPIKAEAFTKGYQFPIALIQHRAYDPEMDDASKVNLGKLVLTPSGITFGVPRQSLDITAKFRESSKGFPELNIALVDVSGSMAEGVVDRKDVGSTSFIPWGDKSKYHFGVLGWYGVLKYLQRQGLAGHLRYNMITFSEQTTGTGEREYADIDKIKRKILSPNFGSDTLLDTDVLARETRPGSVLLTISDGEIRNWSSIKDDFKKIIADKYYAHFQIGNMSDAANAIKRWGKKVIQVKNAQDLPKQMIDLTAGIYASMSQKSEISGTPKNPKDFYERPQ